MELKPTQGKFKGYGLVRDAFGRIKADGLDRITDPAFRKLIEDAIKEQENDRGSDPSRPR